MEKMSEQPLAIGDRVRADGYDASPGGRIVQILERGYVRVLWDDYAVPLTHSRDSLVEEDAALGQARSQLSAA